MPIRFVCPLGHMIKAADHRAGHKGRCPICHQKVIVPVADPRPSGRTKRSWDAAVRSPVETDQPTPSTAAASAGKPASSPKRKRRFRTPMAGAAAPPLEAPSPPGQVSAPPLSPALQGHPASHAGPAPPPPPALAIDDSAALVSLPPSPPAAVAPPPDRRITVSAKPPGGRTGLMPEPPPRWLGRMRADLAEYVERPSPQQVESVYWLAAMMLFAVIFGAAPALRHWRLAAAPPWAQLVLLLSAAQLAYIAWLLLVPDWSCVRLGGIAFALVASGYVAVLVWIVSTPEHARGALALSGAASPAAGWCGANAAVTGLLSLACGRLAGEWRRGSGQKMLTK